MTHSIVTANLDFGLPARKVGQDLDFIDDLAEIILFQESKNVRVDSLLPDNWYTFQNRSNKAKANSGVAHNMDVFKGHNQSLKLGTNPRGRAMLSRYIAWQNFSERDANAKYASFRVVSVHLPPKRYWGLTPIMLNSIAAFVRFSEMPVIIGGDWNMDVYNDKRMKAFVNRVGGHVYGSHIDGFVVVNKPNSKVKSIAVTESWKMKNTNSDHNPYKLLFDLN